MRCIVRVACLLLTTSLLCSRVTAQSDDWQALKQLPDETKIKVLPKHQRTFGHCRLTNVTDEWIECRYSGLGYRRYMRDEVREVRLGHHTARTGLLAGATVGAIAGLSNGSGGSSGRVFYAIVLTPVLGCLGAGVGAIIDPLRAGTPFYRNPDPVPHKNMDKLPPLKPQEKILIDASSVR